MENRLSYKSFEILTEEEGQRLDNVLYKRFRQWSRTIWQKRIRTGKVLVNQKQCSPSFRLFKNAIISYSFYKKEEPKVNSNVDIVYQDEDIAIISKPTNLPVHPSGAYSQNTLYNILKETKEYKGDVKLVHRLDRETSGLMIVAKNKQSASTLQIDFQNAKVKKEYLALVFGNFPKYYKAEGWLFPDEKSPVKVKRQFSEVRPKDNFLKDLEKKEKEKGTLRPFSLSKIEKCYTEFFLKSIIKEKNISLVKARLHTGRTHQIRASLCSLGFPLLGDRIYGKDSYLYLRFLNQEESAEDKKTLILERTALHAFSLQFHHPITKKEMLFESPLPQDIKIPCQANKRLSDILL